MSSHPLSPESDSVADRDRSTRAGTTACTEDIDLARQLQAGHHDALTALFEKYSRMVFGIACRMLRDEWEAEEVVQQVFIDVYRAINQFDERKGSFKTWLFQYSYNRTLSRKKHLQSKGFYSRSELRDLPMEGFQGAGGRMRLCSQEVAQLVEQLLRSIHPRQRTAIELTFFDGLTAEEIARKTGENVVVVRHNLYRGLSKLRAALLDGRKSDRAAPDREIEGILLGDPARLL